MNRGFRWRKSFGGIVLLICMLSLLLGQVPEASAKTLQTAIAEPAGDTVVLNVKVGGVTLPYTWGDLTGVAGYKFAGKVTTDIYLLEEPRDTCAGIKFADFIADIESTLGLTLADDDQIRAVCSDNFINMPFSVGEARDAANHYLLAYRVNGVSDACIGYKDVDPSVTYPETYLRIARNRGGSYGTDPFGNTAYMRLITTLQITRADGTAVEMGDVNLAQNNGVGLSALAPSATGLVIGGKGITQGMGLLNSFVYLNQAQVDFIKTHKSVDGLGLGSSWMPPTLYSSYDNHGTPEYVYTLAEGINLKTALTALGADVTGAPLTIEATASDNYNAVINDAFGLQTGRNYIAPDGTVGAVVDPVLIFYAGVEKTAAPDAATPLPTTPVAINESNPLFSFGQVEQTEETNCKFVKNTVKVRAGMDTPAFSVTKGNTTKSLSLSDIALMGVYRTSYYWEQEGAQMTHSVAGVPLSVLLAKMGVTVPSDMGLIVEVNQGEGPVAGSRAISHDEIGKCFVAYDVFADNRRVAGSLAPLRIYCPGASQENVLIDNVVGATVSAVTQYTVSFEANGGSPVADLTKIAGSAIETAPFSAKEGYTLEGWYGDAALTNKITFPYTVSENTTLYANWIEAAANAKGDINGDALVNVQDVVLTVEFVIERSIPTPAQFGAADYNSDGVINIQDVVEIVNKILGH